MIRLIESHNMCVNLFQQASEVNVAWRALTIPVLEPLTSDRISSISRIVMGCLLASVSVATTQSILSLGTNLNNSTLSMAEKVPLAPRASGGSARDDEAEACAVEIVEKSLELLGAILALLRGSNRAGGHVVQNFTTMGAWVLFTGLMVQLNKTSQASYK